MDYYKFLYSSKAERVEIMTEMCGYKQLNCPYCLSDKVKWCGIVFQPQLGNPEQFACFNCHRFFYIIPESEQIQKGGSKSSYGYRRKGNKSRKRS